MKYDPEKFGGKSMRDCNFNTRNIDVVFDHDTKTFVAAIRSGRYHRMMDGSMRQMVTATGESEEGRAEATAKAMAEFNKMSKTFNS